MTIFSALDAVRVAQFLVDEGRADSDAITTADIYAAASRIGVPAPDEAGEDAVRIAVDVHDEVNARTWQAVATVDGLTVSDWGKATWADSQLFADALRREYPAAKVKVVPSKY
ncbi:hypothetical protein AB0K92_15850 [Streptomyces sp. NPDC052687]|uniref:hypothetical protein n=1 Tax=Streptomyces sp. NPDC052687 TaxID=3154759 RepID=UPI0034205AAA